ncbi:unnamed protein product [Closterium sp. Naga37s-1]|nr:unnamed protein product [Closterium sp. Naga37s-1]
MPATRTCLPRAHACHAHMPATRTCLPRAHACHAHMPATRTCLPRDVIMGDVDVGRERERGQLGQGEATHHMARRLITCDSQRVQAGERSEGEGDGAREAPTKEDPAWRTEGGGERPVFRRLSSRLNKEKPVSRGKEPVRFSWFRSLPRVHQRRAGGVAERREGMGRGQGWWEGCGGAADSEQSGMVHGDTGHSCGVPAAATAVQGGGTGRRHWGRVTLGLALHTLDPAHLLCPAAPLIAPALPPRFPMRATIPRGTDSSVTMPSLSHVTPFACVHSAPCAHPVARIPHSAAHSFSAAAGRRMCGIV